MSDEKCKKSLYGVLGSSFQELLTDKETHEKLKIFAYAIIESETNNDKGSIKNVIDAVVNSYMKKKSSNLKENEFEKFLKVVSNDLDIKQSNEERIKGFGNIEGEKRFF